MSHELDDGTVIIHAGNYQEFLDPQHADGQKRSRGLIPRSMHAVPLGSMPEAPAWALPTIDESEIRGVIAEMVASQSRLSDIRMVGNHGKPIPAQDQAQKGYCWAHSVTGALRTLRAVMNLDYADLSAYAVACVIKSFRDEGGWCGESLKFLVERGVPTSVFWALRSMDRSNDNAATWANAALHKSLGGFYDLQKPIYDQKESWAQFCTALCRRNPTAGDFNWWGHSVECQDIVDGASMRSRTRSSRSGKLPDLFEFDRVWAMDHPVTGGLGTGILNSWGDPWGKLGYGILTGAHGVPDNAVSLNVTGASPL